MNKLVKYTLSLVGLGLVGYNSVYVKKLDDVKAAGIAGNSKFDAGRYAQTFWTTKLVPTAPTAATDLALLLPLLKTDKEKAFTTYSQGLGIGNIRYFLVRGEGRVTGVGENDVMVSLPTGETVHLATEYIFGNAARDASGLIRITEFETTTDLNNVSEQLNDIIRKQVIPSLKTMAKPGNRLRFVGAMELNRAHTHLDSLTLIPLAVH
ncbi:MAG: hypothetical protein JWP57_1567 [Spirosoma sp.]|nr:hypothetical protein [Spirosoma sp.]